MATIIANDLAFQWIDVTRPRINFTRPRTNATWSRFDTARSWFNATWSGIDIARARRFDVAWKKFSFSKSWYDFACTRINVAYPIVPPFLASLSWRQHTSKIQILIANNSLLISW